LNHAITAGDYMIPQITISNITLDDIPYVVEINRICLPENYPYSYFQYVITTWPDICFVSRVDDKVVGYVLTRVESGLSSFSFRWVKKGHVISIAVLPEYRNQGIGTKLMLAVFDAIRKYSVNEIILEVRVSNPAQHLYKRLGFRVVKTLRHYYSDGEDAYLMAKRMNY